jgi:hypothetical protein
MTDGWTPLWSNIVESSLWEEPDVVVKVFLTMLAKKGSDDVVIADAYRIAKWANKTEDEVLEALRILEAPDRRKKSPQVEEGRRIRAVDGGWLIINGAKYREEVQRLFLRAKRARLQKEYRDRQRAKKEAELALERMRQNAGREAGGHNNEEAGRMAEDQV